MNGKNLNGRRGFLGSMFRAAMTAAACWLYGLPTTTGAENSLAPLQQASLTAVLDTLIPDDEYPGALRAGVPARIDELLTGSPRRGRLYRRGLQAVDRAARTATDKPFRELSLDQRGELLEGFQTGYGPGAIFFRYLRYDVMTAFYSSPEAYAMLGYEPPVNGYPYTAVPPAAPDESHG